MSLIEVVDVQVLKAWYCDQPLLILPSQDVWSVGVMVLALLSPTPLTQQVTGIPVSDALGRCKHAFQETWHYQHLDMLALEQAGVALGNGDRAVEEVTRRLVALLQRCLNGDPFRRPHVDELEQEVLRLQTRLTQPVRLFCSTSTLSVAAGLFSTACGPCQNDAKSPQCTCRGSEGSPHGGTRSPCRREMARTMRRTLRTPFPPPSLWRCWPSQRMMTMAWHLLPQALMPTMAGA
jgi:serine/threonine protein kinase